MKALLTLPVAGSKWRHRATRRVVTLLEIKCSGCVVTQVVWKGVVKTIQNAAGFFNEFTEVRARRRRKQRAGTHAPNSTTK